MPLRSKQSGDDALCNIRTSTSKICHVASPCVSYVVVRAAIIPRHVSAPCMLYVVSDVVCAGRASPCRCVQSRAATTHCVIYARQCQKFAMSRRLVCRIILVCGRARRDNSSPRLCEAVAFQQSGDDALCVMWLVVFISARPLPSSKAATTQRMLCVDNIHRNTIIGEEQSNVIDIIIRAGQSRATSSSSSISSSGQGRPAHRRHRSSFIHHPSHHPSSSISSSSISSFVLLINHHPSHRSSSISATSSEGQPATKYDEAVTHGAARGIPRGHELSAKHFYYILRPPCLCSKHHALFPHRHTAAIERAPPVGKLPGNPSPWSEGTPFDKPRLPVSLERTQ